MKTELKKILSPLEHLLSQVEEELKVQLYTGIPVIDDCSVYLFKQGGKRIRASLVLLSCGLSGSITEGTIAIAAASEIVHGASLIHDDIIDNAFLRRGNISIPKKWGNKVSVLVGDFLYTLALNVSVKDGNPDLFPTMVEGTKDMVKGELYQLQYSRLEEASRSHYFKIIELKTARFMAACAKLGAIKGNFDHEKREELYNFGLNLGYAFQIIDDTLDLIQTTETIGKDIGSDFKDGKITLPFLLLLEEGDNKDFNLLKSFMDNPDEDTWEKITLRLRQSNAIDASIDFAKEYVEKALQLIYKFPESDYREMLIELSKFFIDRKF